MPSTSFQTLCLFSFLYMGHSENMWWWWWWSSRRKWNPLPAPTNSVSSRPRPTAAKDRARRNFWWLAYRSDFWGWEKRYVNQCAPESWLRRCAQRFVQHQDLDSVGTMSHCCRGLFRHNLPQTATVRSAQDPDWVTCAAKLFHVNILQALSRLLHRPYVSASKCPNFHHRFPICAARPLPFSTAMSKSYAHLPEGTPCELAQLGDQLSSSNVNTSSFWICLISTVINIFGWWFFDDLLTSHSCANLFRQGVAWWNMWRAKAWRRHGTLSPLPCHRSRL